MTQAPTREQLNAAFPTKEDTAPPKPKAKVQTKPKRRAKRATGTEKPERGNINTERDGELQYKICNKICMLTSSFLECSAVNLQLERCLRYKVGPVPLQHFSDNSRIVDFSLCQVLALGLIFVGNLSRAA